ncbi:hypothetical protein V7122_25645 [Bacillus sp. JJ1532]|uniref:hypothetical protein n=1 Tax=Bacillus sp. JJ1532 TaxID=3122958 RepID=UPI002FFDAA13
MPTFKSIKEIEKWIATNHGQEAVMNEAKIRKILKDAGKQLEGYLKSELEAYFTSYTPVQYERSGNTVKSIRVDEPKKISINEWSLEIYFDDKLANHDSVMGSDQPKGYTPWLLEVGWDVRDKVNYKAEMFTHHKGTQFVSKAINRFNANNPYGLMVSVTRNGEKYI